jgi:ABC-type microcin C transport system permease subunit YejB
MENRFINMLWKFLRFAEDCQEYFKRTKVYTGAMVKASNLVTILDGYISQSFSKEISRPVSLKLNGLFTTAKKWLS